MTIREQVGQLAHTLRVTSDQAMEHSILNTIDEDDAKLLEEYSRVAFICSEALKEALSA